MTQRPGEWCSPRVPRRVRPEAKVATAAVALVAAVAGWLAPHTPRPDLADDGEGV
ncbi:hypothetical protein GCM10027294_54100 [Marinactinospora endophytica]